MIDSSTPAYDVLIIGGRVAGASLALLLGQHGHRVIVVDRDQFPSDTMSTHYMSPTHVSLLDRLGVLPDLLDAGFRRILRTRTYVSDCMFEAPIGPGNAFALAPRRDRLDSILMEHALRTGQVDFHDRTRAQGLIYDDGRVTGARVQTRGGESREIHARVVVGADGKFSNTARWVGSEAYQSTPAMRPAYYGYFEGLSPLPDATLEIFFNDDRIAYLFPMQPGMDCLAIEFQPEEFAGLRQSPRATFERLYRSLPTMESRLANARLAGQLIGTKGIENYIRTPYGPGWALTGDAGLLMDPSTGLGIGDAIAQSFLLATALSGTLRGDDWDSAMAGFHRRRDEMLLPLYQLTLAFTAMQRMPDTAIAHLRALLASPVTSRTVASMLPQFAEEALPGHLQPLLRSNLERFMHAAEANVSAVAAG